MTDRKKQHGKQGLRSVKQWTKESRTCSYLQIKSCCKNSYNYKTTVHLCLIVLT